MVKEKKSKKGIIFCLIIVILVVITTLVIIFKRTQVDYEAVEIGGVTYYQRLTDNTWSGKYIQDVYETSTSNNIREVVSYDDYIKYVNEINESADSKILSHYEDKDSNYIILSYADENMTYTMELIDCVEKNNQIYIYGDEENKYSSALNGGYFIAIPTNMPIGTDIEYIECYSDSEIKNLKSYGVPYTVTMPSGGVAKPIIYLYPTEETKVTVKLGNSEKITASYPEYTTGWEVLAEPNGTLTDLTSGRTLYSLYYEGTNTYNFEVTNEGFVVKSEDITEFLEEKLAMLGLTEREAEEFIIYWLPILQENEYNYIRFATYEEIEENMPLEINPNPDTIIRVLMTYKGLDEPIEVEEQKLVTPERTGFVAVEWGGTEIK